MKTSLIIILVVIAALLVFFVIPTLIMSYIIFSVVLVRTGPEKWGRGNSAPDDEEQVMIYDDGQKWGDRNAARKTDVSTTNDGFKLCGEYFDFGSDKAVIIIPGRMEACTYSYHFAYPYEEAGFNVLVIDNRSHGLSEGKYNSLGFKEYRDIIAWAKMLHDTFGNAKVVLHGICIGSSTALFALTSKDCPDYLCAMTADGMYETFYQTFKNHMKQQKRPMYPYIWEVMLHIRVFAGANVVTDGPVKRIKLMNKPILFIHSKEDVFSLPEKAQKLYDYCPSENKKLEWFDVGGHSRVRLHNTEKYDATVVDFMKKLGLCSEAKEQA